MICQYSLCLLIDHFKERVIFATSYCIFGLGILLYIVYYFAGLFNVEVALLSELEFKHQVTTARGEGGRRGRGA